MAAAAGGVERGADLMGAVDVVVGADLERLLGWSGGRLLVDLLGIHGTAFSRRIGDIQVTDNIEAPPTVTLYRAYLEQRLLDDQLRIAAGIYAVDWEFDIAPSGDLFVHSSFGTGGDLGNAGRGGASIYPASGLGLRVLVEPVAGFTFRAAVTDGVPRETTDPCCVHVSLSRDDGAFVIAEAAYDDERVKVAVGAWRFTTRFEERRGTSGVYALAQVPVAEQWGAFVRAGAAEPVGNLVDIYIGGAVVGRNLVFDEDRIGVGVASARPVGRARWETAFELTWLVPIVRGFGLQPVLQAVTNPGFAPVGTRAALVVGARGIVSL